MLRVENFSDYSIVKLSNQLFNTDDETKKIVDDIWDNRSPNEKKHIFNGQFFSAINISCHEIQAIIVEYKYYFAKLKLANNPLLNKLAIFPIAVSGLLECKDGYVFGKRSFSLSQEKASWELVPSGGLDANALATDENINFKQQLLIELHEEIGITDNLVTTLKPFCCVIDEDKNVIDIGIYLYVDQKKEFISKKHSHLKKREYDELSFVKKECISSFFTNNSNNFVDVSQVLLKKHLGGLIFSQS